MIVDLRPDSRTFLQHVAVELTAENGRSLYVPPVCLHGFQTLVERSEVSYMMTGFYDPQHGRGFRWNDPAFGIRWPEPRNVHIIPRDAGYEDFSAAAWQRSLAAARQVSVVNELQSLASAEGSAAAAAEALQLMRLLQPICRSITGNGVRETLQHVASYVDLKTYEVPSGTRVFDWEVPKEWNIKDAWLKDPRGRTIASLAESTLRVVSYSTPIRARMSLAELRPHLHSLPDHPDWIPYRTSYYREAWGFCLRHRELEALAEGEYEVCIDSTLDAQGSLTYAECLLPGATAEEFLLYTHVCHPATCNDNLTGIAALALARPRAGEGAAPLHVSPGLRPRERSARSPGWRATRRSRSASATDW